MVWWALDDDETEGGVLEFPSGWELHVYEQRGQRHAVWITDDASYFRRVEVGRA
jgi:hypothetical protein